RKNAVVRVFETFPLQVNSNVVSDEMVVIGTTQNRSENVFRRLAIELFFKWMKQHLSIKKFYGFSEQTVQNQVYLAMIVYCLNVL
ncbi:transposase, partial [Virgibacillus pantothenticus]|uniref:transposase n=1 Tax=Virgibacillus pantothenticus TaxID=1473 RepID=UPI001BCD03A9